MIDSPSRHRVPRTARPKSIPKFARKSAMGIDAIFRESALSARTARLATAS